MFKKWSVDGGGGSGGGRQQLKSSHARKIVQALQEQFAAHAAVIEALLPKKAPMVVLKCPEHVSLVTSQLGTGARVPLFVQTREGKFVPTMRLLHQCVAQRPSSRPRALSLRFPGRVAP